MNVDRIMKDRASRDQFLREHYASPLPEESRDAFPGLDYFPVEAGWAVRGEYEATDPHSVQIPSSAGMENPYSKVGIVEIEIEGAHYRLTVLDDGDGEAFIPFRDGTCGEASYEGGRYVGVSHGSGTSVEIDFNLARNPWCVYDEEFICPLPPVENWISSRIPAGEKDYQPTP